MREGARSIGWHFGSVTHVRGLSVPIEMKALVTGATGFVGGRLTEALAADGADVRCMVRDASSDRAKALADAGHELHEGDVLEPESLRGIGRDVDIAYYLIHSMGRGGDGNFEERGRSRRSRRKRESSGSPT
jgi:uncharacterized protein YbjT (DUF2867 family)